MAAEYDVVGGYVPSFVEHLKETGERFGLGVGLEKEKESGGEGGFGDSVEHASLEAHALSPWAPAEYDAFFRALSVHSRWRPDLIAACIPTRSEWEVWMYLEALEEGVARLAMERDEEDVEAEGDNEGDGGDVEMVSSGSGSQSASGSDSGRDGDDCRYEPAYEVSQEWIDAEEVMASWIVHEESLALATHPDSDIDDDENQGESGVPNENATREEPSKRKRGRPRTSEKGRSRGRSRAKKISQEVSSSPSPSTDPPAHRSLIPDDTSSSIARKHSRELSILPASKRRRIERKRDALMGRLDSSHLLVLESILREGDNAMKEGTKSREGSVSEMKVLSTQESESSMHPAMSDPSVQRETGIAPLQLDDTSNAMIDPVLLAMSGVASEGDLMCPDPGPSTVPGPSIPAQTSAITTFTFPHNMVVADPEPPKDIDSDLSLLSPRGRRRFQKRLYMRRKRALLRENSAASESILDTRIEKLKPGRKVKSSEPGDTPGISKSTPCSEVPSDEEMEKNEVTHSKGGLTLPYKIKARFSGLGVDSAYLHDQGMDLLNLGALGRLMGLFTSLEQSEQGQEGAVKSPPAVHIDAQLVKHLQTALVSFVTDILHKAIVWKEGEKKLKDRSRAWRYGDQVTISAIEHAVRSVGSRYHSHKEYFKSAVTFYGLSNEANTASADATDQPTPENTSADTDAGTTDGFAESSLELSLHREMYTPHVRPPSVLSALKYLSPTYELEATRTRRGSSADLEDDLMADETDEDALDAELESDDEVDSLDLQSSSEYEQSLWNAVRIK